MAVVYWNGPLWDTWTTATTYATSDSDVRYCPEPSPEQLAEMERLKFKELLDEAAGDSRQALKALGRHRRERPWTNSVIRETLTRCRSPPARGRVSRPTWRFDE